MRRVFRNHQRTSPPPPYSSEVCLERRGTRGRWVLDWGYANRSAYPNHGSYSHWHRAYQNFTATPSQPYRLATAYRWVDDECPVREVDLIGFCRACAVLGIDRILVLGDSLNIEFEIVPSRRMVVHHHYQFASQNQSIKVGACGLYATLATQSRLRREPKPIHKSFFVIFSRTFGTLKGVESILCNVWATSDPAWAVVLDPFSIGQGPAFRVSIKAFQVIVHRLFGV